MKTIVVGFIVALAVVALTWWPLAIGLEALAAGKGAAGELGAHWRQLAAGQLVSAALWSAGAAVVLGVPWFALSLRLRWLGPWRLATGVPLLSVLAGGVHFVYRLTQGAGAQGAGIVKLISVAARENTYSLLALAISGVVAGVVLWLVVRRAGDSMMVNLDDDWEATEKL